MEGCIFCKIISGEIPCEKIYENEKVISFRDINPEAPAHVLILPKKHISSLNELEPCDSLLISEVFVAAKDIAIQLGVAETGYRVVVNCGEDGGQTVGHIHFHMLAGRKLNWPPG